MLEIRNLDVCYGTTKILSRISLTLNQGCSLALIGESGTGKTTLAKTIVGLCEGACTGEILFKGQDILGLSEKKLNEIRWNELAIVTQNVEDALNPLDTALDQVAEPMVAHGLLNKPEARKRAEALLAQTGLPGSYFQAYPHQLSGGQKQRVMIAMALANDPEVLILDEPTSALDPLTKEEIISLIQELGRNRALLVVTHDLAVATRLTEKTAVLYGGRIVEMGDTGVVLSTPKHPYTRGLLRSYPKMARTKDLQGIPGQLSRPERGCPFEPRCTQRIDQCRIEAPELTNCAGQMAACHRGGIVPLLELKRITKYFAAVKVLESVNLTLYEGETTAVVGPSGSGKTTLAKIIIGLEEQLEGTVFLENLELGKREKQFYRRVQMIYQNPAESLSHRLTVLEAVREPLEIHHLGNAEERLQRVKQVLGEVELPSNDEFLETYPHHLSGGEAQRVAIARALILEPKLLIADEPTSALDPSVQAKVLRVLLNLQEKRGLGILLITHDLALARKVSDRIIVLNEGGVLEEGPSSVIVSSPKHPYTRRLLEAASANA